MTEPALATTAQAAAEPAAPLLEGAAMDLRRELLDLQTSLGFSDNKLAGKIGISPSRLSQWSKGKYAGDNDETDRLVRNWMDAQRAKERSRRGLPEAPKFLRTPLAGKVLSVLEFAHQQGDVGLVGSVAGEGKTIAIEHYRESHNNVYVLEVMNGAGSVSAVMKSLCESVGVYGVKNVVSDYQTAIVHRLKNRDALVVIDEAQHCTVNALDAVRGIHDKTLCGLVYAGNTEVWTKLTGGRAPALAQLYSRVGMKMILPKPTRDDVAILAKAWNVDGKAEQELLFKIALTPGHLRVVTKALQRAAIYARAAKDQGGKINAGLIANAWRALGGGSLE